MKRHPTTNEIPAPPQINTPLTRSDLTNPEKLILVAREYYGNRFPNERRADCPAPGVIQAARDDRMPADEIRAHLFRCSECFNEFGEALRDQYRQTASDTAPADRQSKLTHLLSRWRSPTLAGATALLLLAAGLSVWRREQTAPQSSQNRPQHAPVASPEHPVTPRPSTQPLRQRAGQTAKPVWEKPHLAQSIAINLDLNRSAALGDSKRGASLREAGTRIKLPPQRALLKLRLREGSEAGLYQISIVDPDSNPLVSTSALSADGSSLEAVLDLRFASEMAHRLRIECGDDLNEYLIEIEKP